MAENIDKDNESEGDSINNVPATPLNESAFELVPNNISQNKEANNMETHAHHLHHVPGKKIWHYFYEFLMLFLAVFFGFLAENLREHHVENLRAKEYAKG